MKLDRLICAIGFSAFFVLGLSACSDSGQHGDLRDYIEETKRRPAGEIEPLPSFVPYKSFAYSAMALRSPFDPPAEQEQSVVLSNNKNIKPDFEREKEVLEGFNFGALRMVGTLTKDGAVWALINDGESGIHRVTTGNYIGMNHGRIVAASNHQIEVIEIVPNGTNGWVERPQVLSIQEKD